MFIKKKEYKELVRTNNFLRSETHILEVSRNGYKASADEAEQEISRLNDKVSELNKYISKVQDEREYLIRQKIRIKALLNDEEIEDNMDSLTTSELLELAKLQEVVM